jgi:two-component system, NtrC family, sensor kinase
MNTSRERILLVESDPDVIDIIARQTLQALGYRVEVARQAATAIKEAVRFTPDVVIANMELPGLSGKDLLVALSSQGLEVPIIVLAQKGMEADIIQAFRLGATDYLLWPAREAEVVSAVERVLKQVRSRREREQLAKQLKQTNDELQRRVRELTTIFALGKAVTSITDQNNLFEKIVEGAVYVTEADFGWLLLREDRTQPFKLSAQRGLPVNLAQKLRQPWDDGISSLVALSGETLSIHGEPLARFKVSQLGKSALIVPVKIKKEVVGLLVVMRKAAQTFTPSNQTLLEAVADYASIALVNARLFRALEERARSMQQAADQAKASDLRKSEIIETIRHDLNHPLAESIDTISRLLINEGPRLNATQKGVLRSAEEKLRQVSHIIASLEGFYSKV